MEVAMARRWLIPAAVVMALSASTAHAVPLLVYSNDFDNPEAFAGGTTGGFSGVAATTPNLSGYVGLGAAGNQFGGNWIENQTNPPLKTTLTLNNLPAHSSITLGFLLGIIRSWDSTDGFCCGPDLFNVDIDGVSVFIDTYNNALGTINNTLGLTDIGGGKTNKGGNFFSDQAFDATGFAGYTNLAHTASTLVIDFYASGAGWQGGGDESFSVDNVRVTVNTRPRPSAVAEPGTLGLLGLGLLGLGAAYRRRKAA
jgi:hypothetical protein